MPGTLQIRSARAHLAQAIAKHMGLHAGACGSSKDVLADGSLHEMLRDAFSKSSRSANEG